jgi:hypothetical protein
MCYFVDQGLREGRTAPECALTEDDLPSLGVGASTAFATLGPYSLAGIANDPKVIHLHQRIHRAQFGTDLPQPHHINFKRIRIREQAEHLEQRFVPLRR